MLATKLRALYQRKKGRDLFDIWKGIIQPKVQPAKVIEVFKTYMHKEKNTVTCKQFIKNVNAKIKEADFTGDIRGLLRPEENFNAEKAYNLVRTEVIEKL